MMKKALATLFLLALTSLSIWAQIPNGYYNNANGKTGDELKVALHNIIKGHHVVSYGGLLNAFAYTDCKPNGKIWDIYSNYEYSLDGNCGEYIQEGDCWNREHTWPQSWFNEQTTPRSDLFHVYPTDGFVNGQRSNYPYGEVNNPIYTSGNGSKLGNCVTSGYSGKVFEPIDEYKGDIARSYFYMSVRYYSEDSEWGTSNMTNKSEILPWAMTMLLRWSDEDPVSDKEIARNNAVYGYQNNRNPFIDHPEYARMIWDPNWQGGMSYNITCATGLSHGIVSAPESAIEGSTVSITATPDPGYMVGTYNVYKTANPNTTVSVSSNGTFTMPGYAVTVSATFVQNNNYYSITLGNVSHGTINASETSAKSGTTISLMATPNNGYSLYSWYVFKTGDMNTTVNVSDNSFVMPAFNVTVMATFVQGSANGDFEKVTSAPTDWSGEYILVYEQNATTGYVWTGVDAVNSYVSKTISSNTIADDGVISITIAPMSGGYSIRINGGTNNGKYIFGTSGSNKINFGSNPSLNTLSYESNSVKITSNSSVMRFNNNSGQNRFRYFQSSTYTNQQPVQLYKRVHATQTHSIHFNPNGGSGTMGDQTVNEFEPTALQNNAFTREGFVFEGWNTAIDGTGDYYADGATVTLLDDLTLYAQWEQLYTITLALVENGSISASSAEAIEETIITLTAMPAPTYELDHWIVTDAQGNAVTVTENQFEMPASNVTVNAVFVYVGQPFEQKYYLVTSTDQLVAGRTYLIVNTSAGKALGTTQNNNNRSAASVTISNNVILGIGDDVCELTLGGQSGAWTFYDSKWNTTGGYLYAASSSANHLKTQANNDANGQWSISFGNNGMATIEAQGDNTRNNLRYNPNSGNPIFSCYANSSNLALVNLYIRSEEFDHTESETIANLFYFDKHTVHNGATLMVTGTATCNDASQLVIEDGGQLVHHNGGVQATVKKYISAYTENGGWYTIAVPFASYNPATELTTADYDLYSYGEAEWINYKAGNFLLSAGNGYLYAHNPTATLRMRGTLNSGDFSQTVSLDYEDSHTNLKGFNLLGNPTAHEITFSKTDNVSDGYYYLDNSENWVYTTSNIVPVGRAFLVKANAEGQTVTLNSQTGRKTTISDTYLYISVGDEKVSINMDNGVDMPVMDPQVRPFSLYLTHDQQSYVMLVLDRASVVELNYIVKHSGEYTLSMEAPNCDLDYLHLFDKQTVTEVDLLSSQSYTFKAQIGDDASRFLLMFKPMDKKD
jgi:uncharacterized repeat protein (TIGR02543 family)